MSPGALIAAAEKATSDAAFASAVQILLPTTIKSWRHSCYHHRQKPVLYPSPLFTALLPFHVLPLHEHMLDIVEYAMAVARGAKLNGISAHRFPGRGLGVIAEKKLEVRK